MVFHLGFLKISCLSISQTNSNPASTSFLGRCQLKPNMRWLLDVDMLCLLFGDFYSQVSVFDVVRDIVPVVVKKTSVVEV